MKKYPLYLLCVLVFSILSCDSEDDLMEFSDADYFPLEIDNTWNYDNTITQNNTSSSGNEEVTITSSAQNTYQFSQNSSGLAGVFTSVLASGEVSKQNQKVFYTGELKLEITPSLPAFNFPLDDVVFYDPSKSQGELMSTSSGEFQQSINGFPVDFRFEINSTHNGFISFQTVNGVSYEDVFVSETSVKLSASTFIVISDFSILQEQQIITITNYYAKDIGLILSDVEAEIIFEDIPEQLDVEIPDVSFTSEQQLQDYTLIPNS